MALPSQKLSEDIDRLLERYLGLLHQHETLRKKLRILQSSTLQNIARANFEAPRGTRYGEDLYDARMQASRLCRITVDPEASTTDFTTLTASASHGRDGPDASETMAEKVVGNENEAAAADAGEATKTYPSTRAKDPIRMFGLLNIPSSLRTAQSEAIKMVDTMPQLVSVDAQMKEIEIQIRRARKHRSRAEAAEGLETAVESRNLVATS